MRHLFASLTSRLVLTVVALVVLVAVLIGAATTLALNAQLTHQLDDDVRRSAGRPGGGPAGEFEQRGRGPRTVLAQFSSGVSDGVVVGFPGDDTPLTDDQLDVLGDVPADGDVHEVDLPDLGTYRVIARTDGSRWRSPDCPPSRSTRPSPR